MTRNAPLPWRRYAHGNSLLKMGLPDAYVLFCFAGREDYLVMTPNTMKAMVLTGHGGIEKLEYKSVPTPSPAAGEVLVQVTATAKNNTDRKAREGLYPTKKGETTSFQMGGKPTLIFPRIQDRKSVV